MANENESNAFSPYIRPIITLLVTLAFLALVFMGKIDAENLWYVAIGVISFWFGDRFITKYASLIEKAALIDPKAPNGGDGNQKPPPLPDVEDREDEPTGPPKIPIPFDPIAFKADVDANVAIDYAGIVNESTPFFEARDKVQYRWSSAGKLNNTKAVRDMWNVIVDYAKVRMAKLWQKVLGQGEPSAEFLADPIKYVNDHFADFRNCPSCKPSSSPLVDIKWLALALNEGTYTSYLDLIDAQEQLDAINEDLDGSGNEVW